MSGSFKSRDFLVQMTIELCRKLCIMISFGFGIKQVMRITESVLLMRLLKWFHSTSCYLVCLSIVSLFLMLMFHTLGAMLFSADFLIP